MSDSRRGFTLWELVLVLTLLGVMAGVTLPAFTGLGMAQETQPADAVLHLLRDARRLAIARGSEVSVLLDPASRRYRVDTTGLTGGRGTLVDTTLVLASGTTLAADSARVRFRFLATGAAIADTLRIRTNGKQLTVTVDPWEGVAHAEAY
jgi:prepilin-type N-terminal cleavage/methylation domain-containing protein